MALRVAAVVGFSQNKEVRPAYIDVFLPTRRHRWRVWQLILAASLRDVDHNRGLRRVQRPPSFKQLRFKIKSDSLQICGARSRPSKNWYRAAPCTDRTDPVSRLPAWLIDHQHTPQTSASSLPAAYWASIKKTKPKLSTGVSWNALCSLSGSARDWTSCLCQLSGLQSHEYSMEQWIWS